VEEVILVNDILKIVSDMPPEEALTEMGRALKSLFKFIDEDAQIRFLMDLTGEAHEDKVSSLVHL
jgi:hypothetical protein